MDYYLTVHARDALTKRGIAIEWMEQVLYSPEWTEPDLIDPALKHHLAHIAANGNRVLRVVVNINTNPQRVITAYFDRRRR